MAEPTEMRGEEEMTKILSNLNEILGEIFEIDKTF